MALHGLGMLSLEKASEKENDKILIDWRNSQLVPHNSFLLLHILRVEIVSILAPATP